MKRKTILIYGAYGYTGSLIAHLAVERGLRPILSGRNAELLRLKALSLGLDHRPFSLDDPFAMDDVLRDVALVIHCAGPFAHTAREMVEGCLRKGVHYLDITGELTVFEMLAAMNDQALKASVMLMPGVGFDVVPSDCLALHLKNRLPSATHLTLAFDSRGTIPSRGTLNTVVENMPGGGAVRREGHIVRVPSAWKTRRVDFGRGPAKAVLIPWGDVATAWHSTGIPNIEVYSGSLAPLRPFMILSRYISGFLASGLIQRFLKARIRSLPPGPSPEQRAQGYSLLWGEARDGSDHKCVSRMRTPESYHLTALTALAAAERVLAGHAPPGFQTPAKAYGADFVLDVDGVSREDL